MHEKIIISIGSNYHKEANTTIVQHKLCSVFKDMRFTLPILNRPYAKKGQWCTMSEMYLNFLGYGYTDLNENEIISILKRLEQECGNSKILRSMGKVAMDLDLMLYGQKRYHLDDWQRDYIITLLKGVIF